MELTVQENDNVTLTCVISGSPKPLVTWEKEELSLPPMSRSKIELSESRNMDTGIYTVRK